MAFLSLGTHVFFGFRRYWQGVTYFSFGVVWLVYWFDSTLPYPDSVIGLGGFFTLWTFISVASFYVGDMVATAVSVAD